MRTARLLVLNEVAGLDLEKLLASTCRQKIIKAFSECKGKEASVMLLVRKVNGTYTDVNRNLKILEAEGIITNNYYGRMRIIKLNMQNPKTTLLLQALKTVKG
jgi:DNA-binding transcriptional ArsR family regulator